MKYGAGFRGRAAFRVNDRISTLSYPTTTALADSGAETMRAHDQIPILSETLAEDYQWETSPLLTGQGGISEQEIQARMGGGALVCPGHYLGLGPLIACTMGWEAHEAAGYHSPEYSESIQGLNISDTAAQTSTTTLIVCTNLDITEDLTGEWVRVLQPGSPSLVNDIIVRRISAVSTPLNTITPVTALDHEPDLRSFQIARGFRHKYEMGLDLAQEIMSYGEGFYKRNRCGTLCLYKTLSTHEFRGVMVDSMTIRAAPDGVNFEFALIFFDLDMRTSGRNADPTGWNYSASPTLIRQERVHFGDGVFRLGDYSTEQPLSDTNKRRISAFELTIANNLSKFRDTESGFYLAEPSRSALRQVTGRITIPRLTDEALLTDMRGEVPKMADLIYTGSILPGLTSTKNQLELYLRYMVINKVVENITGPGLIEQHIDFTCLQPPGDPAGMPTETTGSDNSEAIIQLSNNDPFNAFMYQNAEV